MSDEKEQCSYCEKNARWVRHTQFAGSHPFCDEHAREEPDFKENDSYEDWEDLEAKDETK